MSKKNSKSSPEERKEELRERILSDTDRFFKEWPVGFSDMEQRGRMALYRSLGEAAVLVKVAQEHPDLLERIPTKGNTDPEIRRYQRDTLVRDVVHLLMSPVGKDESTKVSKYITAIRFLLSQEIKEEELATTLKEMGGVENVCKRARKRGICEMKEGSDPEIDPESTETQDDRYPELDENFLKKLIHVDFGMDTEKLFKGKTILARIFVEDGPTPSSWKPITGEVVKIEE